MLDLGIRDEQEQRAVIAFASAKGLDFDSAFFELRRQRAQDTLVKFGKDVGMKNLIRQYLKTLDRFEEAYRAEHNRFPQKGSRK